jgi:uracil-DNA glycosylase
MAALHRAGFANQPTSRTPDDGLRLTGAFISMAVRCAPPGNRPLPEEIDRCLEHLDAETACLPHVRVVIGLGKIGFDAWLRVCRRRGSRPAARAPFGHGEEVRFERGLPALVGCYHPSRQNTNTGRLTPAMLDAVLRRARTLARQGSPHLPPRAR